MKILAFSTKQNIRKKNVLAHFSESKGGHGQVWNKILYVTRAENRFFSGVVTALAKRFFPQVGLVPDRSELLLSPLVT